MDKLQTVCSSCNKKCSSFDSRSAGKNNPSLRIHHRCLLRKKAPANASTISSKNQETTTSLKPSNEQQSIIKPKALSFLKKGSSSLSSELIETPSEREIMNRKALEKRLEDESKSSSKSGGQFFFDLEKGVAKPHEKKQYLSYKKTFSAGDSFDDSGFKIESSSRGYDHRGKDVFGGSSDSSDDSEDGYISLKPKHKRTDAESGRISQKGPHSSNSPYKRQTQDNAAQSSKHTYSKNYDTQRNEQPCWFCLSAPQCEKNLVIAIGNHCYLALDKGGLTDEHMLILPIDHICSTNDIQLDVNGDILDEIDKFKNALIAFNRDRGNDVIFFERNFRSIHFQIHAVPIPSNLENTVQLIEDISLKIYPHAKFLPLLKTGIVDTVPQGSPYFMWHIFPSDVKIVMPIKVKECFFPLQFGRQVLADEKILNMPDRVDWKRCEKTDVDNLVANVRKNFKKYDFTLLNE